MPLSRFYPEKGAIQIFQIIIVITSEMLSSGKRKIYTFLTKKILSWFGHVPRRSDNNVTTSVLTTQIEGSRPRGRPRLQWMYRHETKQATPRMRFRQRQRELVQNGSIQNVNPTSTQETIERRENSVMTFVMNNGLLNCQTYQCH